MDGYKAIACCYIITNIINGKKYIGQTFRDIKERFKGFPYSHNFAIQKDVMIFGFESFEVEIIPCYLDSLNWMESYLIKTFDTTNPEKGYNSKEGGGNSMPEYGSIERLDDGNLESYYKCYKSLFDIKIYGNDDIPSIIEELKKQLIDSDGKQIIFTEQQDKYLYKELERYYNFINAYVCKWIKGYGYNLYYHPNWNDNKIQIFHNGKIDKKRLIMLIRRLEKTASITAPKPILFPNFREIDSQEMLELKYYTYSYYLELCYDHSRYDVVCKEKSRRSLLYNQITHIDSPIIFIFQKSEYGGHKMVDKRETKDIDRLGLFH